MNSKSFIISLLAFMLPLSLSANESKLTFTILKEKKVFYSFPDLNLISSSPCPSAKKNELCSELDFLKSLSMNQLNKVDLGNQNPSSYICKNKLNGTVIIGYDSKNNEISFCKLPSGLYIDGGTLSFYAKKNDGFVIKPRKINKKN